MLTRQLAIASLLALVTSGCAASNDTETGSGNEPLVVTASFYPIAEIVAKVGGSHVEVVNLTSPGTEAHDAEISAKQLERLRASAIVFYLGDNFQPNVQAAVSSVANSRVVDLLDHAQTVTATGTNDVDPHVWLDPANMVQMAREVADRLIALRPSLGDEFRTNLEGYVSALESLGTFLDDSLADCESPVLVTAHRSFSYLAARARLETNSLLDYSGEDSSTSKDMERFAAFLRDRNVTAVFYEESIARESMSVVAAMVGATTATLNPIETLTRAEISAGADYVSVQRENIARIADGLRCS